MMLKQAHITYMSSHGGMIKSIYTFMVKSKDLTPEAK